MVIELVRVCPQHHNTSKGPLHRTSEAEAPCLGFGTEAPLQHTSTAQERPRLVCTTPRRSVSAFSPPPACQVRKGTVCVCVCARVWRSSSPHVKSRSSLLTGGYLARKVDQLAEGGFWVLGLGFRV